MNNLPSAGQSPRVVNGVLFWYEGDTFEVDITLQLKDDDDEPVIIGDEDTVKIVFYDNRNEKIAELEYPEEGEVIENNTVTIDMDSDLTADFPAGEYSYNVLFTSEKRTTIAKNNMVVVE